MPVRSFGRRLPVVGPRSAVLAVFVLVAVAIVTAIEPADEAAAQASFVPADLVSITPAGGAVPARARNMSISALGDVAGFEYESSGIVTGLRERPNRFTTLPRDLPAENHGLSDDGCVIAYSGPVFVFGERVVRALQWFNRCTGVSLGLTGVPGSAARPRPALDADGSVVVFAVDTNVVVFTIANSRVANQVTIPTGKLTALDVAVSDDGNTVAVALGTTSSNADIYLLDVRSQTFSPVSTLDKGVSGASFDPSISGDGTLVAYRGTGSIMVYDRTVNVNRRVMSASSGRISNDGRHLAVRLFAGDNSFVFATSSPDRWLTSSQVEFISYPLPGVSSFLSARDPVISDVGRWVGWTSPDPVLYVQSGLINGKSPEQGFVRERRPVLQVQSLDFGSTLGSADLIAAVRNVGPSGWRVTSIETTGDYVVLSEDCPDVLNPGEACTVAVRFLASEVGPAAGELLVRDDSYQSIPLVASGSLVALFAPAEGLSISPDPVVFDETIVGQRASTRVASVTNTGDVAVTVQSIAVVGAAGSDYSVDADACTGVSLAPLATCQIRLGFEPGAAGARDAQLVATGTRDVTASAALRGRGADAPRSQGLSISPDPVVFDETIVGQRASSRVATVTNTGDVAVTVQSIAVVGAAGSDYSVDADACTGVSLAPLATCQIRLGFEPGAAGARDAQLVASGGADVSATAILRGVGRFDAVLTVLPEVVSGGQVVSVNGQGYPPAATVEVTLAGSSPQSVLTDIDGAFHLQWLVLEGTPQGVLIADDVASVEYDAEPDELTVVVAPMRPQGVATRTAIDRRHVSR